MLRNAEARVGYKIYTTREYWEVCADLPHTINHRNSYLNYISNLFHFYLLLHYLSREIMSEYAAKYAAPISAFADGQFMNPGPAPRPPTNPTRLQYLPQTSSLPENKSQINIFPTVSRGSTSSSPGSLVSLPVQRQAEGQGGLAVIKQGPAYVKEGKTFLTPWKNKFLVLRKESLDFHKTEGGKISYTIVLKDVLAVSRVEAAGTIFEIKRAITGASNNPGDDEGPSRSLQIRVKGDDDLYEWIDFIYARCPGMGGVSNPTNFSHSVHVGFDSQTGEFVGLPPEWSKLLNSSAITKEDYERNPQAVFEVLEFYSDITKQSQNSSQYNNINSSPLSMKNQSKQTGYSGGTNIAPPRQTPNIQSSQSSHHSSTSSNLPLRPTPPEASQQWQQTQVVTSNQKDLNREAQRQREREAIEEQNRKDLEAYNASLPKTRPPIAQMEIGGFGNGPIKNERFNPSRAAPPAPTASRLQQSQQPASNRPQKPSLSNTSSSNGAKAPVSALPNTTLVTREDGSAAPKRVEVNAQRSPENRYPSSSKGQHQQNRPPVNGPNFPSSRLPASSNQVKPLNVAVKANAVTANGLKHNDPVKAAEAALTSKPSATEKERERKQDVRMSTMSETEVMAKLKEVVSKDDPNMSYSKQKKIGQGASGSVYVAKIKENPLSIIAKEVTRQQGLRAQVAIKQMDLAHQPRKELIVNEIMVMKDSRHRNIVNFLDAFLRNNCTELWVVMEYMEGGALTDVIDNNPLITEEQISTICLEVCSTESFDLAQLLIKNKTCSGLAHLHAQDIIHRDIKSDNVLLDARGNVKISKKSILIS